MYIIPHTIGVLKICGALKFKSTRKATKLAIKRKETQEETNLFHLVITQESLTNEHYYLKNIKSLNYIQHEMHH